MVKKKKKFKTKTMVGMVNMCCTHQSLDAPVLADGPPGAAELGHVGDRLGGQTLELFVRVAENLDHRLQSA